MERVVPLAQRIEQILKLRDVDVRRLTQPVDPWIEDVRLVRIHQPVGAERRIDLRRQARQRDRFVIGQRVRGIVGRADSLDAERAKDSLRAQLRRFERLVRAVPHAVRALLIQQLVDAEVALQLEMRPVIERIAQRLRHRLRPREKLVSRRRVARAECLGHTARPHRAPLVMIPFEPDLEQIREPAILGDILRRQMAVIVDDGLRRRVGMKQPLGGLRLEQEIIVYETHEFCTEDQKVRRVSEKEFF